MQHAFCEGPATPPLTSCARSRAAKAASFLAPITPAGGPRRAGRARPHQPRRVLHGDGHVGSISAAPSLLPHLRSRSPPSSCKTCWPPSQAGRCHRRSRFRFYPANPPGDQPPPTFVGLQDRGNVRRRGHGIARSCRHAQHCNSAPYATSAGCRPAASLPAAGCSEPRRCARTPSHRRAAAQGADARTLAGRHLTSPQPADPPAHFTRRPAAGCHVPARHP